MNVLDLAFLPALEQARLIRQREISPLELLQVYLTRIERLDGQLGSFFTVTPEQAIATAHQQTESLPRQTPCHPPPRCLVSPQPLRISMLSLGCDVPMAVRCCTIALLRMMTVW
ncbi:hypothetical protein [Neosynechococcus sphagnicola]|uniref:hypothetical protein n=1 Tax=Neosynechococcus sphagnicola TaxID=1501145 RepID=UPI001EF9E7BC|nr:hypothetical protein [Neosynechococcus sphagnicola]